MTEKPRSDALVLFGVTGDLVYKKIFPALQSLVRRGRLDVPVISVSRSALTHDELVARATASVTEHGGLDPDAFPKLAAMEETFNFKPHFGWTGAIENQRRALTA